ncbi:MAG: hypothetical protein RMJ57_05825 [Bacteroidia bacterium]|nr:hypothetical protein [Bacteroidia bacterium]
MLLIWLQGALIGLTSQESRWWRRWGQDTAHWDSILRSWGYWEARPTEGKSGPKYRLVEITWRGDTSQILSPKLARQWKGAVLTPQLLRAIPLTLQRQLLEAGFLFSAVQWESLHCDEKGSCRGKLLILPGTQVKLDTVIIRGKWNAPRSAFYQITGLRPRQPLRLAQWEALPRRIRSSPYAVLVDTPQLWLFPNLAWIEVQVKPKTGNRIDGALSLIPSTGSSRAQLIGQVELTLLSPFRLGEKIEARFAQLPGSSQRLHLSMAFPYLLRGYIEARGHFTLWRQDTSFLTREGEVETRYRLTPTLSLLGGYQITSSRLINTLPYRERVWPPPPILDFQRWGIRLGWQYEQVDFRLSPRRGWQVTLTGMQGRRGYIRNAGLPRFAYERLPAVSTFQELKGTIHKHFPMGKLLSLHLLGQGYRYLSSSIFENELLRVGGAQGLRAFPENTFPTAGYLHLGIEPRLHIDEEGYLGAFLEGTLIDIYGRGEKELQALGLSLQTRLAAGLLRLTFASGRIEGSPWDLRRTLVRLEWVSEF